MNTTISHTPGPWHVGGKNGSIVYDDGGNAVADAKTFHGRHDGDVQAANAQLIADAPVMLEACKLMLHWLEDGTPDHHRGETELAILELVRAICS